MTSRDFPKWRACSQANQVGPSSLLFWEVPFAFWQMFVLSRKKQTNKQTHDEERLVAVYKGGRMSPLLFSATVPTVRTLKGLNSCHNESGFKVLVWATDHVWVDGYTVRNPKLISAHILSSGTGGLQRARNPARATSMYSGTRLIQTLRGHAIVSVLSGCPY